MKKALVSITCLVLILGLIAPLSLAQENEVKTVEAKGMAALTGDVSRDRENAINDALRQAVERVVGTYVESETLTENFVTVKDEIYTKAVGFVAGYNILSELKGGVSVSGPGAVTGGEVQQPSEGQTGPGEEGATLSEAGDKDVYTVTLSAEVSLKPLSEKLKAMGLLRNWRVMVAIPEIQIGKEVSQPAAETQLIAKLGDAGYYMVDQKQSAKIRETESVKKAAEGNLAAAGALAKKFGADIFVAGDALAELAGTAGGGGYEGVNISFKSCRGRLDVKAIRADTGEIIAAQGFNASGADISETVAGKKALVEAANQAAEFLIEKITMLPASVVSNIQLAVHDMSFERIQKLEEQLKQVKGVKRTILHEFDETAGMTWIDVEFSGKAKQLAQNLAVAPELKGFKLKITGASQNRIDVKGK